MQTGEWDKARVTAILDTSKSLRMQALLALYDAQTPDEQANQGTRHDNGVGFSRNDAEILSSIAQQVKRGLSISAKQMQVLRSRLPRYWRQIAPLISPTVEREMHRQEARQEEFGSW